MGSTLKDFKTLQFDKQMEFVKEVATAFELSLAFSGKCPDESQLTPRIIDDIRGGYLVGVCTIIEAARKYNGMSTPELSVILSHVVLQLPESRY